MTIHTSAADNAASLPPVADTLVRLEQDAYHARWIRMDIDASNDSGSFYTRSATAAIAYTFTHLRPAVVAEVLPPLPDTNDVRIVLEVARVLQLHHSGARLYMVGGYVRDALMGITSADIDVEVFGITADELKKILETHGTVDCIGESFGVLLLHGCNIDWCLPRRDSKVGRGHRGFEVHCDATLTRAEAVRRRDLTINALMADPLSGEVFDPCTHGLQDLRDGVLRAVDAQLFGDDPLRGLRAVRFAGVYGFRPHATLLTLMEAQDLSELSPERLWIEWEKIARCARLPSIAFKALDDSNLIRFFPQLAVLRETVQEAEWHPEGDVYTHTAMVCDRSVALRTGDQQHDCILFFSALCHDLGKPTTTVWSDGRWRSPGHEQAGIQPTKDFLHSIHSPLALRTKVCGLVRDHLKPFAFFKNPAGPAAYRRLARNLDNDGVGLPLLADLCEADYRGRTLPGVDAPQIEAVEFFRQQCAKHGVANEAPQPLVLGRHLLATGYSPGKTLGAALKKCFDYQLESGETIIDSIIEHALDI